MYRIFPVSNCGIKHAFNRKKFLNFEWFRYTGFYSHYHSGNLGAKIVLWRIVDKIISSLKLNVRSVNVLNEPQLCEKYCIGGVPTTLIIINNNIVAKLPGESDGK